MGDQDRLDLIQTQARIAKAALSEYEACMPGPVSKKLDQAILAIEAIALLADSEFHAKSNAA